MADPDLGSGVPADELAAARRLLIVPRAAVPVGRWEVPKGPSWAATGTLLMLVDGLLARTAELGGRSAMQLLGPGDVFDPWAHREELLPCDVRWHAYEPSTVAALDARFAAAARRWPALSVAIQSRLNERADRLAAQAASLQLSNVDQRLIAILWQLADRFGRIHHDGVVLPLQLSHQMLGQLVGAQRPTVTLALGKLAERGDLVRRDDGGWLLSNASREILMRAA